MNNLRKIRQSRQLTQRELAEKVGKTRQYIGDLENGRRDIEGISFRNFKKICDVLNVTSDALLN